jgi:hypothetical protein
MWNRLDHDEIGVYGVDGWLSPALPETPPPFHPKRSGVVLRQQKMESGKPPFGDHPSVNSNTFSTAKSCVKSEDRYPIFSECQEVKVKKGPRRKQIVLIMIIVG